MNYIARLLISFAKSIVKSRHFSGYAAFHPVDEIVAPNVTGSAQLSILAGSGPRPR
ncbi:MAG: hypothetical protein VYB45_12985 [Pseudomonadota bacterium]|jgi:hypothetical protein|nr:hypothetical protein [Pseudomonadota bacterium]